MVKLALVFMKSIMALPRPPVSIFTKLDFDLQTTTLNMEREGM